MKKDIEIFYDVEGGELFNIYIENSFLNEHIIVLI